MSDFEGQVAGLARSGLWAVAMAMGQRTGLLHVLLDANLPMSAAELALKANRRERYVREWLVSMAMWGIVEIESSTGKFFISELNKALVAATVRQIGIVATLCQRFESVARCFKLDGPPGLNFGDEGGISFLGLLGENEAASAQEVIDSDYLVSIPGLRKKLRAGIDVAEFGSNAGATILRLAQRFPNSRFRGSDIVESVVKDANRRVQELGLGNVTFETVDLCSLPPAWVDAFDWVFVRDVIHDLPYPERGVANMTSALRKGGVCSVMDISAMTDPAKNVGQAGMDVLSTLSLFFCVPHALSGNPQSPALGTLHGLEKGKQLLTSSGLTLLQCNPANFAPDLCHYVLQK